MQENPLYGKYREKGLSFGKELDILFKDVVATGKYAWAPTSGILPTSLNQDDDVYRPSLERDDGDREEGSVEIEEGSGDSEEFVSGSVGPSAGVSGDFQNINLSASQGNSTEASTGKRKRNGIIDRNQNKKKIQEPA